MHVAVVNLTGGGLSGGYVKYLRALIPLLTSHTRISSLVNYLPEEAYERLDDLGADTRVFAASEGLRGFRKLSRQVRNQRPDVVFIPTARWLDCGDIPTVSMVRNMEPLAGPWRGYNATELGRIIVRRVLAKRACRRATRIIAVSQFVADYLQKRGWVPAARLGIVRHGVHKPTASTARQPEALARLEAPFLFTAGSIRAARGLDDAIRLMAYIKARDLPHKLVIGGDIQLGHNKYYRRMCGLIHDLNIDDRVCWTGQLSQDEMAWCFRRAELFVMTSRVEACPNTALEAMSHGCLSVSTNCDPMPEFFANAALYYPAGNTAHLARAVFSILRSTHAERDARRRATLQLARKYRWENTADNTVTQLERARCHRGGPTT